MEEALNGGEGRGGGEMGQGQGLLWGNERKKRREKQSRGRKNSAGKWRRRRRC